MTYLKYIGKRLLLLIPVIVGITFVLYFIMALSPGNPAQLILGADATAEQIQALEEEMGLNDPIIVQYLNYMLGVIRGDFGTSWVSGYNVLGEFILRIPNTLLIAVLATVGAVALGIPMGIYSAVKQYSLFDYGGTGVAMVLVSGPAF